MSVAIIKDIHQSLTIIKEIYQRLYRRHIRRWIKDISEVGTKRGFHEKKITVTVIDHRPIVDDLPRLATVQVKHKPTPHAAVLGDANLAEPVCFWRQWKPQHRRVIQE
jgi:hypothetical protein